MIIAYISYHTGDIDWTELESRLTKAEEMGLDPEDIEGAEKVANVRIASDPILRQERNAHEAKEIQGIVDLLESDTEGDS